MYSSLVLGDVNHESLGQRKMHGLKKSARKKHASAENSDKLGQVLCI